MKIKSIITFGAIATVMAGASCSSEQNEPAMPSEGSILEVSVDGIDETRAVIEGKYLPNGSKFSLWAYNDGKYINGGQNVPVSMNGTSAVMSDQVYIPAGASVNVTAVYPYSEEYDETYSKLDLTKGVDYLWGEGLTTATALNPKVSIRFKHVLSRITLNFTVTSDNDVTYSFSSVNLTGDGAGTWRKVWILNQTGVIDEQEVMNYEPIPGQMSADILKKGQNMSVTFLVAPTSNWIENTEWSVKLESTIQSEGFTLPATAYQAGVNYVYNVQVSDGDKLVITDCEITPWENTNMSDINITE